MSTSSEQLSFERQVAAFLGGMAEDVPLGVRTPPRAMLRRARVHMTASMVIAAATIALAIVGGTLLARGAMGGFGPFHGSQPNGRSNVSTNGSSDGVGITAGSSRIGSVLGGSEPGLLGRWFVGGLEGPYDRFRPPGGVRGPDGGSWGRPPTRQAAPGSGGSPGAKERSGAGGEVGGSSGWQPPPIWVGGSAGGIPVTGGSAWGGQATGQAGMALGADPARHGRHRHRGASRDRR